MRTKNLPSLLVGLPVLERGRSVIGLEGFYKLRCIGIADAVADLLDLHVRSRQEVGGASILSLRRMEEKVKPV